MLCTHWFCNITCRLVDVVYVVALVLFFQFIIIYCLFCFTMARTHMHTYTHTYMHTLLWCSAAFGAQLICATFSNTAVAYDKCAQIWTHASTDLCVCVCVCVPSWTYLYLKYLSSSSSSKARKNHKSQNEFPSPFALLPFACLLAACIVDNTRRRPLQPHTHIRARTQTHIYYVHVRARSANFAMHAMCMCVIRNFDGGWFFLYFLQHWKAKVLNQK